LKKRTKKLLLFEARCWQIRDSNQKFFASFFQKRSSFFLFLLWLTEHLHVFPVALSALAARTPAPACPPH
jgi:hypothetical protein